VLVSVCFREEGVLWKHMQSFLVCSINDTKGLGTRCVLVERMTCVNEQEGKKGTMEKLMFGGGQILSLGSFSAEEHCL